MKSDVETFEVGGVGVVFCGFEEPYAGDGTVSETDWW